MQFLSGTTRNINESALAFKDKFIYLWDQATFHKTAKVKDELVQTGKTALLNTPYTP